MTTTPISILPYVALQPDFASVLADVRDGTVDSEDIFLSGYQAGSPSVHGKVKAYLDDSSSTNDRLALDARDGVNLKRLDAHRFSASVPALGIADATLRVPSHTISFNPPNSHNVHRISSFDVSPDASLVTAGHLNGELSIQSASVTGSTALKRSKVHLSTVLSVRFFPSSKVILSSSSDLAIHIISADTSPDASFPLLSVARTLKGHTSAVTDTHIVGVGKTVYSCGKDGSVRLWDVASAAKAGSTLASESFNAIRRMAVASSEGASETADDRTIYAALQNGTFNVFDTRSSRLTSSSPREKASSPLLAIAADPEHHLLATGSAAGIVSVYDTRQLAPSSSDASSTLAPLHRFKRSDSTIDDLHFSSSASSSTSASLEPSLLVATGDGFPYRARMSTLNDGRLTVEEEFAAHADEGVRSIRVGKSGDVWTAGDDGLARRYTY